MAPAGEAAAEPHRRPCQPVATLMAADALSRLQSTSSKNGQRRHPGAWRQFGHAPAIIRRRPLAAPLVAATVGGASTWWRRRRRPAIRVKGAGPCHRDSCPTRSHYVRNTNLVVREGVAAERPVQG